MTKPAILLIGHVEALGERVVEVDVVFCKLDVLVTVAVASTFKLSTNMSAFWAPN